MFGKRIPLFKLFGFTVNVDLSWLVLAVLVSWSLAKGLFPHYYKGFSNEIYWWMGIAGAVGLFVSIVFHELPLYRTRGTNPEAFFYRVIEKPF